MTHSNQSRRFKGTLLGIAAAAAAALPLSAQDDDTAISLWEDRTEAILDNETRLSASDVTGWDVRAGEEDIGTIKDLVVDVESGEITHAIVSTGSVLGIGGTDRIVSSEHIRFSAADERATFTAGRDTLEGMPEYEADSFFNRDASADRVDRDPARQPMGSTAATSNAASRAETAARTTDGSTARSVERDSDYAAREDLEDRAERVEDDMERGADRMKDKADKMKSEAQLANKGKRLASDLIGMEIVDEAGEEFGNVDDLILASSGAEIQYVVISAGGFMNLGDSKLALPVSALSVSEYDDHAELPISRASLESADQTAKDWLSGVFE